MELLILKVWGRGTSRNMDIQNKKDNLKIIPTYNASEDYLGSQGFKEG